jgi:retinol dehydrogenase-14
MSASAAERVAVVTGASSGIGLYTALGLARAGMRTVMTGRDRARTEAARRFVAEQSCSRRVEIALGDFSRLAEVRRLADDILSRCQRLDLLVNNAGLFSPRYRLSGDGFELAFAVNHLAPFLLTNLLLERLRASAPARIVTVASEAHRGNRIDIDNFTRPRDWTMMRAYGRSNSAIFSSRASWRDGSIPGKWWRLAFIPALSPPRSDSGAGLSNWDGA